MNGTEVFRFAVRCVPQAIQASLEEAGLSSSSLDWLLLHQVGVALKYSIIFGNYCCSLGTTSW